jgi:PPOX class probable FMN-dependent enzyme
MSMNPADPTGADDAAHDPLPWAVLETLDQLTAIYGAPNPGALKKVTPFLTPAYRDMVSASRFCALATVGAEGLDCSPRGDRGPVVTVWDERTLLLPDHRGNNRIDSLRNIIRDPRVALLFFIPPATETLRINGRAWISTDPALCARLAVDGHAPRSVIVVRIAEVYWQCARALVRSGLWVPDGWIDPATLPTPGTMLIQASGGTEDGVAYDATLRARQAATMY